MIRVAVIGAGSWGRNIIRVLHELDALAAVYDIDAQVREECQRRYPDIPVYDNIHTILENTTISAIMLATPSPEHYKTARCALLAGKDVYIEKPMALHASEGEELVSLAGKNGCILMVGHLLHYHPAVIALKELLSSGKLGDLRYIHAQRLNFGKFRTGENVLWSFAPHDLSLALSLAGSPPSEVRCYGSASLSKEVADTTFTHLIFSNKVHCYIYVSWLYPFKEQRFVVVGTKQMAVFDDRMKDKLVIYPYSVDFEELLPNGKREEGTAIPVEQTEPLHAECVHFLECIESRTTPFTDGQEGVQVLKVLDACQHSLETGTPVTLR